VAVVGYVLTSGVNVPLSLARDAATNAWGLAYEVEDPDFSGIDLATSSDGGASWTSRNVITSQTDSNYHTEPSLAMWQGSFHLAFANGFVLQYVTGKLADAPAKWKSQPVPLPGGYTKYFGTVSLALDGANNPGIAFLAASDADFSTTAVFWGPVTGGASMVIGRNDGSGNDNPDIALSFFGKEPRIATDAIWNYELYMQDENHNVWAMRGVGDGSNWLPAVNVPSDGDISVSAPLSISSGSQGQTAIVLSTIHGGVGDGVCGYPKLARSDDFLTFTTCGPAPVNNPHFAPPDYPVVQFWGNDKLWLAFHNWDPYSDIGLGLVLWREP
jgi:hypothetical protein